ncbi:MAG: hypothetical protein IT562_24075 [Alphaproteobacteria bacterium]|nr:hypothetical protein [Alphaproteobacteria bacterium]
MTLLRKCREGIPALLLFAATAASAADDIAARLDKAKADLAAGQAAKAYLTLSNALADLAPRTPLLLTAGAFADGPSIGYGQYTPRPHNVFTRDQPMQVYVEPAGFDHAKEGASYRISLACDYAILDAKGKVLTGDRSLKEIDILSRQANSELGIDLTLPLFDLSKGDYTLEIVVRDRLANDSAKLRLPFKRI